MCAYFLDGNWVIWWERRMRMAKVRRFIRVDLYEDGLWRWLFGWLLILVVGRVYQGRGVGRRG